MAIGLDAQLQKKVNDGTISEEEAQQIMYQRLSLVEQSMVDEEATMTNPIDKLLGLIKSGGEYTHEGLSRVQEAIRPYMPERGTIDLSGLFGGGDTAPVDTTRHFESVYPSREEFYKSIPGWFKPKPHDNINREIMLDTLKQLSAPSKFENFEDVIKQTLPPTAPLEARGISNYRELEKSDLSADEKFQLILEASRG